MPRKFASVVEGTGLPEKIRERGEQGYHGFFRFFRTLPGDLFYHEEPGLPLNLRMERGSFPDPDDTVAFPVSDFFSLFGLRTPLGYVHAVWYESPFCLIGMMLFSLLTGSQEV